MYGHVQAFF